MKTAISLPDELFAKVERLVQAAGRSRSEVYADALRDYVARHAPDEVTASLNRVLEDSIESPAPSEFVTAAARRVLAATQW